MEPISQTFDNTRYAKCIRTSERVRWEMEKDIIRGRKFDRSEKYLPDGMTLVDEFTTLSETEKRFVSQIQGRTYARVFGVAERFVNAKVLEISRDHWFGDQVALEALVRFSEEEIKHQALFRRIDEMVGETLPDGYRFDADPNEVAQEVLGKSTWAVLALTLDIELFTQLHYRESIRSDDSLSALYKDVFLYHWKEESQHAILDDLEWRREDAKLSASERDAAVDELIELAAEIDEILQMQAIADTIYFRKTIGRRIDAEETEAIKQGILKAYRWQYIFSGAEHPHFVKVLTSLTTEAQFQRIGAALATLV